MIKKTGNPARNFSFYPVLIGVYPVLSLYLINKTEIAPIGIVKAIITSLIITGVVSLFGLMVFRSWEKASPFSAYTLFLLLIYGHIFNLLSNASIFGTPIGRHRYLLPLWGMILFTGLYAINKLNMTKKFSGYLNTISVILIVSTLIQIGIFFLQIKITQNKSRDALPILQNIQSPASNRDVYYILVDAYSRKDLLQKKLGLNTDDFIDSLKNLGFYIPNCAQSNYDSTSPSLASSLNMDYLDALGVAYLDESESIYTSYIHNNVVKKTFEKLGYQTVTFKAVHPSVDISDSTLYFDYFKDASAIDQINSINFQYLFINTTILLPFREYLEAHKELKVPAYLESWMPTGNSINSREFKQYQQNLFALQTLETLPDLPGKKFVYAHLFVTHQPYVFYPDGQFRPSLLQTESAYRDQVIFANQRLLEIIKSILEKSKQEPIIIIQSDHSFFQERDRLKILNAYYLPGDGEKHLYNTITPVNTFRFIFNTYYNADYEILPDVSRYIDKNNRVTIAPSTCIK